MKKLLTMRNILIAIAFTVFLLVVKDNLNTFWNIIKNIGNILTPFFIGFLIAYILNFPYKFLYNKAFKRMGAKHKFFLKFRKPLALIITYAGTFAVIVALIMVLVPQIINNLAGLVNDFPKYYSSVEKTVTDWADRLEKMHLPFLQNMSQEELLNNVSGFFTDSRGMTETVLKWLQSFMSEFMTGVYNSLMGIIISIYFLIFKEELCFQLKKMVVAFVPIKYLPKIYEIVDITDTKCGRFLVGDIIDAGVLGVLFFIVLSIFRFPYASLIAVICGVCNIIPFFGPFIGAIPSCFILLLIDPWLALWFILIVCVMQQIDGNLLRPYIVGNQVGLSGFWVLFSVILGGALFGIIGFILGTPIYAVIYSLIAKRARNKIEEKGKIAQEALDFKVLNYTEIAEEQRRLRAEKEAEQRKKLQKLLHLGKEEEQNEEEETENFNDKIGKNN